MKNKLCDKQLQHQESWITQSAEISVLKQKAEVVGKVKYSDWKYGNVSICLL